MTMKLTVNCTPEAAFLIEAALKARIAEIRERIRTADGMNTDGYIRAISSLEGAMFQVQTQLEEHQAKTMTSEQLHQAAVRMEREGGGFAGSIADAYFEGDAENKARLVASFGHLFARFQEV